MSTQTAVVVSIALVCATLLGIIYIGLKYGGRR